MWQQFQKINKKRYETDIEKNMLGNKFLFAKL